ncbi:hypothetical protein GE09DRAFT_1033241 [Coniochaeta sp. 2T2.1]|nr:hypothetical protein GE09DRAFT_1033241 [Coniochaeta sp. 2T2.1]
MLKPAVTCKRSACDLCRAKRVRCLRAENSTEPCARCSHIGAICVTGAPGHPGRPPKSRLFDGNSTPLGPAASPASPADMSSPAPVHAPAMAGKPTSAGTPAAASRRRAERHTSWDRLDCIAGSDLAGPKSVVHPHLPGEPSTHEPQLELWEAPGDVSGNYGSSSIEQSPTPSQDILALVDQLSGPSHLQGLLSSDDEVNAMLHFGRDSGAVLDMDMGMDPLFDLWDGVLPANPPPQCFSPASSLTRFREDMDQRIKAADAFFSDPVKVVQGCKEGGAGQEAENPAALLLTCSKEFIDIIQSLTPAGRMHMESEDAISTELVLLALSGYLALMRLFDSLFHTIHRFICQMSRGAFKSVKVKSVLRIGGVSALQDMPLKTYATGILDAIQCQVRTLECCMGIPTEYCLLGEADTSTTAAAPGMFSRPDRARLFWAVMSQEDVKSRWGSNSYVESIRANIQDSMAFLDD